MRRELASFAALAALAATAPAASAQGFGVFEHGTCAMARAGTGVADPCDDGSAIFFNPAGLTGIRKVVISGGVTVISAFGGFTDDLTQTKVDLANDPIPIPHAYVAVGLTEKFTAGIGIFVPFGLGTVWPSTFEGRFNGYDNDLRSIYVQPTIAYQIADGISIGAGLDYVISAVELNQRLDASELPTTTAGVSFANLGVPFHTDFANATIKATNATGIGANFGITIDLSDRVSFGARYLMKVDIDYDGTVDFEPVATGITLAAGNPFGVPAGTPLDSVIAATGAFASGGTLSDQGGATSLPMPDQFVAGFSFAASDNLKLLVDYQLTRWSAFESIVLDFSIAPDKLIREDYTDAHGIRGGFEYSSGGAFTLRGGYLYHTAAAPDETVTPLLPEGRRNEVTAGFGLELTDGLTANLAYQYIRQDNRRGRVREPSATTPAGTDLNTGVYEFRAHLVGLTFTLTL